MAENTKIEWCDASFSPWLGCQHISPGCDRCFAESWSKRSGLVKWGPGEERKRTSESYWKQPFKWAKRARATGTRPKVFCASLCDVFDNQVPPEWRADLFEVIRKTPELDWLLLTKRPQNIAKMAGTTMPWNVWLGFTAEDQEHFDQRWPIVAQISAVVRFCSYEPAIGPLRIHRMGGAPTGLHWLICGEESGTGRRWLNPKWEYDIRRDCEVSGIAYFFKKAQRMPLPLIRQFPTPEIS